MSKNEESSKRRTSIQNIFDNIALKIKSPAVTPTRDDLPIPRTSFFCKSPKKSPKREKTTNGRRMSMPISVTVAAQKWKTIPGRSLL